MMTGYGPQESRDINERMEFFITIEEEVIRAGMEGKSVVIMGDLNSKLGSEYVSVDPHDQSDNGQILAIIIDGHDLTVVSGLVEKRTGVITRERTTVNNVEKSVIDFFYCEL